MNIGYFADAQKSTSRRSQTHIVDESNNPLCGAVVSGDFQFVAGTMWSNKLECKHCKRIREEEHIIAKGLR